MLRFSAKTDQDVQETDMHYDSSVFPRDAAPITHPLSYSQSALASEYRLSEAEREHYDAVRHIEVAADDLTGLSQMVITDMHSCDDKRLCSVTEL
jgi:hypothetical protein